MADQAYKEYEKYLSSEVKNMKDIHSLADKYLDELRLDLATGGNHVSASIKQLGADFQQVYESNDTKIIWKYVNCLELLTRSICTYHSDDAFSPLVGRLMQRIFGAASMFHAAKYIPLRLRCINMINRIAAATDNIISISLLLADMLEMMHKYPEQPGVSIDFCTVLEVDDDMLMSEKFQEECVLLIVKEFVEHLAQQSYSFVFPEVFEPILGRLNYCATIATNKSVNVAVNGLITKIKKNSAYIKRKRKGVRFGTGAAKEASFLLDDKKGGVSPLSKYLAEVSEEVKHESERVKFERMKLEAN